MLLASSAIVLADRRGQFQRVGARQLEDRDADGRLGIEHAAQRVGLGAQLDACDVAQVDDITDGVGLDDDVAEFGFGLAAAPAH